MLRHLAPRLFYLLMLLTSINNIYAQQEITPLPLDKLNRDSLDKIIEQKEKEKDSKALGILYGGIYNYYLYSNSRDSAIKYAMKAEENTYKAGDSSRYYFIQLQMGDLSTNAQDFNTAKMRFDKALHYYTRIKNYTLQTASLGALSYMYELRKDIVNQLKYLGLAEKIILISKDTFNMVGANDKRAGIMMNKNQFDTAISLLKKNLFLLTNVKTFGNSENIRAFWKGWQLNKLADCYYRKKNYALAIRHLKEALPYDNQTSNFDAQNIFRYRFLINSYIGLDQKDSAVKYVESFYNQTLKTLQNLNPEKIKEISTKYETEKKEREIDELQQKNRLQQLTVSNQRKLNIAFIMIFSLALITGFLIRKNVRQKRKIAIELAKQEMLYKEQLHKQKELQIRNRLHRDLHDDLGATLSSVKAYSEILKDNPDNMMIADLIKENSAEMIDRLEVISWATNPQRDNFKSLQDTMLKFARPLCHSQNIEFSFEKDGIDEQLIIPGDVRQNIFLIFKESINNMMKYAEAKKCSVTMFVKNQKFILQTTDNGIGYAGAIHGNGSGLKNIKKRAEETNGIIEIETMQGKGTIVKLSIPYPFKIPNSWDRKKDA